MNKLKQPKYNRLSTSSLLAVLLFSLIPFCISCGGAKQTNNKTEVNHTTSNLTPIFNVSARTKSFLAALENEISGHGNSIENAQLSEKFIEAYNVRELDNDYSISGFIKMNEDFDSKDLEQIDVALRQPTGAITTVQVPLKSLGQFLKIPGIEYFEISEKVTNK